MASGKVEQGTKADRLTQLAALHRQGVLSDDEYEGAVAKVVARPLVSPAKRSELTEPRTDTPAISPRSVEENPSGRHEDLATPAERLEDTSSLPSPEPEPDAKSASYGVALIAVGVIAVLVTVLILWRIGDNTSGGTSGGTSGVGPDPSIVGTWHFGSDDTFDTVVTITFDADGTWHATYVVGTSDEGPWGHGTWEENSDHAPGNVAWSVTNPEDIEIVVGLLGRDYIPDQVFFYGEDGTYKYFHQGTTGLVMSRARPAADGTFGTWASPFIGARPTCSSHVARLPSIREAQESQDALSGLRHEVLTMATPRDLVASPGPEHSLADRLAELADLHAAGVLSESEFLAATHRAVTDEAEPPDQVSDPSRDESDDLPPENAGRTAIAGPSDTTTSPVARSTPRRVRKHTVAAIVGVVVVAIAGAFIIRSASDREPFLVGTWSFGEGESQYSFTFNDDGTWTAEMSNPLGYSHTASGTWSCSTSISCIVYWDDRPPQGVYDLVDVSSDGVYTYEFWGPGLTGDPIEVASYTMSREKEPEPSVATAASPTPTPGSSMSPQEVSEAFFEAWRRGDRATALSLSEEEWVDWLFQHDPTVFALECSETPYGYGCLLEPGPGSTETIQLQFNVWPNEGAPGYHVADIYEAYPE